MELSPRLTAPSLGFGRYKHELCSTALEGSCGLAGKDALLHMRAAKDDAALLDCRPESFAEMTAAIPEETRISAEKKPCIKAGKQDEAQR